MGTSGTAGRWWQRAEAWHTWTCQAPQFCRVAEGLQGSVQWAWADDSLLTPGGHQPFPCGCLSLSFRLPACPAPQARTPGPPPWRQGSLWPCRERLLRGRLCVGLGEGPPPPEAQGLQVPAGVAGRGWAGPRVSSPPGEWCRVPTDFQTASKGGRGPRVPESTHTHT